MKKILCFAVVCAFLVPISVQADFVRDSGIDFDASTIDVFFQKEKPENNDMICEMHGKTFVEAGITSDNDLTELLNWNTNPCFQQAGDYRVTFYLQDRAGNETTSVHSFRITASDPENIESTVGNTTAWANGADSIDFTFTFKDLFENLVTQLTDTNHMSLLFSNINYRGEQDANKKTSFEDGLDTSSSIQVLEPAKAQIGVTSIAPTIKTVGDFLASLTIWGLEFEAQGRTIDDEGLIDSGWRSAGTASADMQFKPLYSVTPSSQDLNNDNKNDIYITTREWDDQNSDGIEDPGEVSYTPDKDSYIQFTLKDETNGNLNGATFQSYSVTSLDDGTYGDSGYIEYKEVELPQNKNQTIEWNTNSKISKNPDKTFLLAEDDPYPISLAVLGGYWIDSQLVSYYMGGSGLDGTFKHPSGGPDFSPTDRNPNQGSLDPNDAIGYNNIVGYDAQAFGADIEGGVLGIIDRRWTADSTVEVVDNVNVKDVREKMVENGWRLVRNANTECVGDLSEFLSTRNCDVVIMEADVKLSDIGLSSDSRDIEDENGNVLRSITYSEYPSGQKTLIIKNGNLIIDKNVLYEQNSDDSFGVILLNDSIGAYPKNGNIFVDSSVQYVQGNFFAEGALMNIDNGNYSIKNGNIGEVHPQLLFEGTLFTSNTLGGSRREDGEFRTPWDDDLQTSPWSGTTPINVARAYDLHFIRDGIDSYGDFKQVATNPNNDSSFVIRLRPPVNMPPGFEW